MHFNHTQPASKNSLTVGTVTGCYCVEIAHKAGINSVIQPGGSIRDTESIDYCNKNGISMVTTGTRHFKH